MWVSAALVSSIHRGAGRPFHSSHIAAEFGSTCTHREQVRCICTHIQKAEQMSIPVGEQKINSDLDPHDAERFFGSRKRAFIVSVVANEHCSSRSCHAFLSL
jgi:hypothetical protein